MNKTSWWIPGGILVLIVGFAAGRLWAPQGPPGRPVEPVVERADVAEGLRAENRRLAEAHAALTKENENLKARLAEPRKTETAPPAPSKLKARLDALTAWFGEMEAVMRTKEASLRADPKAAQAFFESYQEDLGERMKGMRELILADPEAFLAFLKATQTEELFTQCLWLLQDREKTGPHTYTIHQTRFDKIPKPLADGLLDFARNGPPQRQRAVLEVLSHLTGQPHECQDLYAQLLSSPDAGVQASALGALGSHWSPSRDQEALILRLADGSPPRSYALFQAMQVLSRSDSPEAFDYVLRRFEQDPGQFSHLGSALGGRSRDQASLDRVVGAIQSSFASRLEPTAFANLVNATLVLPSDRALAVLERAASGSPTPQVRDALERVTADLRQGLPVSAEARDVLNRAFGASYGVPPPP